MSYAEGKAPETPMSEQERRLGTVKPVHGQIRKWRVTSDCRASNDEQPDTVAGLPRPEEFREKVAGETYHFVADVCNGFSHVVVAKASRDILAVWTPLGPLRPVRMTQGTKKAPQVYQRGFRMDCQDKVAGWGQTADNYIDDVCGAHDKWEVHQEQSESSQNQQHQIQHKEDEAGLSRDRLFGTSHQQQVECIANKFGAEDAGWGGRALIPQR